MTQLARFSAKYVCRTAKPRQNAKTPSPGRETVLLHACHFHEPLPAEGAGAVTSVRVTPLEKVRLLRMVEKSPDILR